MKALTLKDSNGRESATLMLCTIAFMVMNFGYIYNMFNGVAATLTEYGGAVTLILAPLLGRDWLKKEP